MLTSGDPFGRPKALFLSRLSPLTRVIKMGNPHLVSSICVGFWEVTIESSDPYVHLAWLVVTRQTEE